MSSLASRHLGLATKCFASSWIKRSLSLELIAMVLLSDWGFFFKLGGQI